MSHTYTLKNLKIAEFASHETWCFEASLYEDGKRIAIVENIGQGGCNSYHFLNREDEDRLVAYLRDWAYDQHVALMTEFATDKVKPKSEYQSTAEDIDTLVNELIERADVIKQAKSFKRKVAKQHNLPADRLRIFLWADGTIRAAVEGGSEYDKFTADPTCELVGDAPTITI